MIANKNNREYIRKFGYLYECQGYDSYMYEYKSYDNRLLLNFDKYGDDMDDFIYNEKKIMLKWKDVKPIAKIIKHL